MAETTVSQAEKKKNRFRFPLWQKGVRYGEVDLAFFLIVIALLVIGIIMMFSASYAWAISEGLEGSYYAKEQIKMAVIGLAAMWFLSIVDYHLYKNARHCDLCLCCPCHSIDFGFARWYE